jgi:hypothetical protein
MPTFSLHGPPKFTQIGIFGLKIYHLATLVAGRSQKISVGAFPLACSTCLQAGYQSLKKTVLLVVSITAGFSGSYRGRCRRQRRWSGSRGCSCCLCGCSVQSSVLKTNLPNCDPDGNIPLKKMYFSHIPMYGVCV